MAPEEKVFLQTSDVTVTSARFIVPGQTYAMQSIASVKSYRGDPSMTGPIIAGVAGLLLLVTGTTVIGGFAVMGGAVAWGRVLKPDFSVVIGITSGDVRALTSPDGAFILRVVNALNDAIIHRG